MVLPLASGGALITMPPRPRNRPQTGRRCGHFGGLRAARAGFIRVRPGAIPGPAGASPSGKALDFDSSIRRFDPFRPSQPVRALHGKCKTRKFLARFRAFSRHHFQLESEKRETDAPKGPIWRPSLKVAFFDFLILRSA